MHITTDWHIHSRHSPCGKPEATVAAIFERGREVGLEHFGVTDHLHCRLSLPGLHASRAAFDELGPQPGFHWGIEASCVRQSALEVNDALGQEGSPYCCQPGGPEDGELTIFLPEEDMARLRPEYIIGGVHWPLGAAMERDALIRQFHRQYMFVASHPRVDIVAHPWWWHGGFQDKDGMYRTDPWLADFGVIPRTMHEEFAACAREHGKAVEINVHAMLTNPAYPEDFRRHQYPEYLALLKELGVTFSTGTDSHAPGYSADVQEAAPVLEAIGVKEGDLWRVDA